MRVIIAGPRNYTDKKELQKAIKKSKFKITQVISGGALGVDRMGEDWATENEIPLVIFPAQWKAFGRAAGHKRNKLMAEYGDALIALDLDTPGTKSMITSMRKLSKPIFIHIPKT